jgi:hypothetical protein
MECQDVIGDETASFRVGLTPATLSASMLADGRSAIETHGAASVLRRRAIAPGRPRTLMIRPVAS